MKEAHFVSILTHPRLYFCAQASSNQSKQLVVAFFVKGQNATSFAKDLVDEFSNWQIDNSEQLHQKILDLLSFVRQKKLEIEFALSLLTEKEIIFATYCGRVILKRNGQVKKILESTKEIKIIVGSFKDNDQIILLNQSAEKIEKQILQKLTENISLEKLVSEIDLIRQNYNDLDESIVFLTYKATAKEEQNQKFNLQKIIQQLKKIKFFLNKIDKLLKKIFQFFKRIFFKLKNQSRKKIIITIVILFLLMASLFTFITISKNQNQKIIQNITAKIVEISKNTNNIEQLVLEQPLQAREIAQKSLTSLEALKNEKNNKDSLKLIEAEINKTQALIAEISSNNALDQLSIAYNLDDFLASKIEIKDKQIFLLENSGQEILHIKADQSREKISLKNNEKIKDFTVTENKLFILSSGFYMLDLSANEQTFTKVKEEGESDKNGEFLSSFGPYLYLLNKDKRNIYRYYYNNDQLSDPIGWLIDKQGVNFDNINDLMVDGDLWLGFKDGNVLKFSKGTAATFQMKGISQLPTSPVILSSNETSNFVAILEKQNKRLLILTKDGQLLREIKSNELAGVSSIALSDDEKKVYALSGSTIYEVEI